MIYDIIIIGAGASGLFAASNIKLLHGQHGLILNKAPRPGLKLLMSGGGQCNLTHAGDIREYITHYGQNGKKIRSILYSFSNTDTCEWFSSRNLPLITRSDGKIFPKSMNAKDVLDLLLKTSYANGFQILNNTAATKIHPISSENKCIETDDTLPPGSRDIFAVATEKTLPGRMTETYRCRSLLIACGGSSYPTTGSDGSIFSVLKDIDISIEEPQPALVPLNTENYPYASLSGTAVKNACVTVYEGKQRKKNSPSITGDILFTHKNFSGPAILDISRYTKTGMTLEINWLPATQYENIHAELNSIRNGCKKKTATVLHEYLKKYGISDALIKILLDRTEVSPDLKFTDLPGNSLKKFIELLISDCFTISGTSGYRIAMATAGGVKLSDIDLNTMESKKYKNLYFTGEVTDIDGDTGGYNLQYSFASAYRAAANINKSHIS